MPQWLPMERLRLPPARAHALEVLDCLAAGRRVLTAVPEPVAAMEPDLVSAGMERLGSRCLQFLVRAGGYRERAVLRGGRRVRARLWDGEANEGFSLRFTALSREVWAAMLQPAARRRRGKVKKLSAKRVRAKASMERAPRVGGTGDWIFMALALTHLAEGRLRGRGGDEEIESLETELCLLSPLATLAGLRPRTPGGQDMSLWLSKLLEPGAVRVVECLDDVLVRWWRRRLGHILRRRPLKDRGERLAQSGKVLGAYLDALDQAGRADLCRPLMSFVVALGDEVLDGDPDEVRQQIICGARPRSMAERDQAMQAAAGVADLGPRLLQLRDQMAARGYGDDRYEEAQLYLADADDILAPARERVLLVAHALSGRLG